MVFLQWIKSDRSTYRISNSGFLLLEILIAISLFTLLIATSAQVTSALARQFIKQTQFQSLFLNAQNSLESARATHIYSSEIQRVNIAPHVQKLTIDIDTNHRLEVFVAE